MQIRRTKIIATLGPATDSPEILRALIEAGADILRINLSHGTHEGQAKRAKQVREVARSLNREVAILADLRGPKIRIERFKGGSVELESGDVFTLDASAEPAPGNQSRVGVTYKGLADDVSPGDLLLLDDGLLTMRVVEIRQGTLSVRLRSVAYCVIARVLMSRVADFHCLVSPNMISRIFPGQRPWVLTTWQFPSRAMRKI